MSVLRSLLRVLYYLGDLKGTLIQRTIRLQDQERWQVRWGQEINLGDVVPHGALVNRRVVKTPLWKGPASTGVETPITVSSHDEAVLKLGLPSLLETC